MRRLGDSATQRLSDSALPGSQVQADGDTDDGPNSRVWTGGLALSEGEWNLEQGIGDD